MDKNKDIRERLDEIINEEEANYFAAYLLMPEGMFEKDLKRLIAENPDECVKELSKLYKVPEAAIVYRVSLMEKRKI